jgi:alpha-galactosidase
MAKAPCAEIDMDPINRAEAALFKYVAKAPDIADLESGIWGHGGEISITDYWSGDRAPSGRHSLARLLWSDAAIHILFEATLAEPLTINTSPDISKKAIGLWDRDVCEIFIAPDIAQPNRYFEFEVAPTGEWLDVGIELTAQERLSNWGFRSGMKCSARIEESRVLVATEIPFEAFGKAPSVGEKWLGNLFRCVGTGPERGYLAWQSTRTEHPNFHVPAAFGQIIFIK